MTIPAPAKLNIGLEVTGQRADGYHDIVTILQTISLADDIMIRPASALRYQSIDGVAPGSDLVVRALDLLHSRWGIDLKAAVSVKKRIPMSAGLGGGSADAAAILRAIGCLAGIPLGEIVEASAALGSDVPFLIQGGTALGTGTGISLEPLPTPDNCWFTIVVPALNIEQKTSTLYRSLRKDNYSDGHRTRMQAARIQRGEPFDASIIANSFEVALLDYPVFAESRSALERAVGLPVHVSGAGPAIFSVCHSRFEAICTANKLVESGYQSWSCKAIAAV